VLGSLMSQPTANPINSIGTATVARPGPFPRAPSFLLAGLRGDTSHLVAVNLDRGAAGA
jgi:hypothetical protein